MQGDGEAQAWQMIKGRGAERKGARRQSMHGRRGGAGTATDHRSRDGAHGYEQEDAREDHAHAEVGQQHQREQAAPVHLHAVVLRARQRIWQPGRHPGAPLGRVSAASIRWRPCVRMLAARRPTGWGCTHARARYLL